MCMTYVHAIGWRCFAWRSFSKNENVRFTTKSIDPSEFNQHLAAGCIYYQVLPGESLTPLLISSAKEEDFDYQCQIKLLERDFAR